MKERVINTLSDIALNKPNDIKDLLLQESGIKPETLQVQAENILNALIQNYSQFNIQTIDTFTHRLVRTFAIDLGLSANFEVELDIDSRLKEAVEKVIDQVGIDNQVTRVLVDYAIDQANEDRYWDISGDLMKIGAIIFDEDAVEHLQNLQQKNIEEFIAFKKELYAVKRSFEKQMAEIGTEALTLIDAEGIPHNGFYSSYLPNFFKHLCDAGKLRKNVKFDGALDRNMRENILYSKGQRTEIKALIDGISPQLTGLYERAKALYEAESGNYFLSVFVIKNISATTVLQRLNAALNTIKNQENIEFLGEFNQIIHRHLLEQPAAYIYERIGERFKHYFIDEMQDTSVLQWKNLIPLIENAVSQTDSGALLVGDAKQSIYRWRGSKPEQFMCLAAEKYDQNTCDYALYNPFSIEKSVENLETNYRSFSSIIDFNNRFFTGITKYLIKDAHAELYKNGNQQKHNSKKGGYVELNFLDPELSADEIKQVTTEKVYNIIQNLDGKIKRSDICILVRKRDEGEIIATYLSEKGIDIESSESLLLKNNPEVIFILNLLRYLDNPEDGDAKFHWLHHLAQKLMKSSEKHAFLKKMIGLSPEQTFAELKDHGIDFDISRFSQTPLYDNVEAIIRSFGLTHPANAYIQFFLEEVFAFTSKNGQSIAEFLAYWELKEEKISIAGTDNDQAVKISTIHKAKGLEYRVVIFPFPFEMYDLSKWRFWLDISNLKTKQKFESIYVKADKKILLKCGDTAEATYNKALEEAELDNLNLLYVTLTRAVEQLYIFSTPSASKKKKTNTDPEIKNTSDLFKSFLTDNGLWEEGRETYTFGDPEPANTAEEPPTAELITQNEFMSNSWQNSQITIVPSASVLWDSERKEAIDYGNLIHQIMERVITAEDLNPEMEKLAGEGILRPEAFEAVKNQLTALVSHPGLANYFKPGNRVFTERELVDSYKRVHKPDRLNFLAPKSVVIIDYKTGQEEPQHISQVLTYAGALKEMGYAVEKILLVYIGKKIHIKNVTG